MAGALNLSCLIVDSQSAMRRLLRDMLSQIGMGAIHEAMSANVAMQKLAERRYDLVLCEYHLGEGQDGQHLMEDARHHGLLPLSTIFIMVTGESDQGRVTSASELAPSDYVLKPFSTSVLRDRLERALERCAALAPAWRALEGSDLAGAIQYCTEATARLPQYSRELQRMRAEALLGLGDAEAAKALFREILENAPAPWAQLGLAKAMVMQKRHADAVEALLPLVAEHPSYVDAQDWLARAQEALGDLKAAQRTIEDTVAQSPHALRRVRRLGEVALQAGDAEVAERALAEVVRKGKLSMFREPEDHVLLVKTQLARGDRDAAAKTIRDLERSMRGLRKTEACSALSAALVHQHAGDPEKAREALARAVAAAAPEAGLSEQAKLDLAKGCLAHAMETEGGELLRDVMRGAADDAAIEKAKGILRASGKAALADEMEGTIREEVGNLVAQGAAKSRSGDHDGAVRLMLDAAAKMPGNVQVVLNASLALLRRIDQCGWDQSLASQAKRLIDQARKRSPAEGRLVSLADYHRKVMAKYGVSAARGV